ncbi:MAG TPA: phosphatidylinositol-specific phospholipase C/glycerophosphodiester phosphodiesterase family protein [Candidatus Hydrogenedentes bacterium]|nr:phosphatidylinositol-specific phospholipase C/glycerophosphodiester phosphodiesterase family protein [Candidatus Hydrogenedentota bacterium]
MRMGRLFDILLLLGLILIAASADSADNPATAANDPASEGKIIANTDTDLSVLPRAHSHNDYTRRRPLFDALDMGFCSVEADIHLINGALLVAHDADQCQPDNTLESMYLAPLRDRVRQYGGSVYPGYNGRFILLIDLKSNNEETMNALLTLLEQYREMLTVFTDTETRSGAVTVILSGRTPRDALFQRAERLAAIDGSPSDLDTDLNPNRTPLVSAGWSSLFTWTGKGDMPENERLLLQDLVRKAHDRGALIRFWGLPRPWILWPMLYDVGVDLLNADNLIALRDLLLKNRQP